MKNIKTIPNTFEQGITDGIYKQEGDYINIHIVAGGSCWAISNQAFDVIKLHFGTSAESAISETTLLKTIAIMRGNNIDL